MHRYYDPKTGRYPTPDPIGLSGGINPFVYSLNNPSNLIDPYGLKSAGIGGYLGFGGDISVTTSTCCQDNKKVKIRYYTSCVGIGIGGKLLGGSVPFIPLQNPGLSLTTYGDSCPKSGDIHVAKSYTAAFGIGANATGKLGNQGAGLDISGVPLGLGLSAEFLKICATYVLDKEVTSECCNNDGDRMGDLIWQ